MLSLHVIASGSSGNAYILRCNDASLLIECGAGKAKDYLNIGMEDGSLLQGALISHKHGDHLNPNNLKDIINLVGCPVYSTPQVSEIYPSVCIAEPRRKFEIGDFKIMALPVQHGDTECYAYVIDTLEGRLVFATDLVNFPYNIAKCNYLCIECNYDTNILNAKREEGERVFSQSQNHMEINTCISCVKRHISPHLTQVVLLHLSNGLSDCRTFTERIRQCCEDENYPFIKVSVANKDTRVILHEIPF